MGAPPPPAPSTPTGFTLGRRMEAGQHRATPNEALQIACEGGDGLWSYAVAVLLCHLVDADVTTEALPGRLDWLGDRVDRLAALIGGVQDRLATIEDRLEMLERRSAA